MTKVYPLLAIEFLVLRFKKEKKNNIHISKDVYLRFVVICDLRDLILERLMIDMNDLAGSTVLKLEKYFFSTYHICIFIVQFLVLYISLDLV